MKKLAAALMMGIMVLGVLTGCGSSAGTNESGGGTAEAAAGEESKGKIALLLMAYDSVRYTEADKPMFEEACRELGYEPIVQSAEGNSETQIQQAENALNSGVSALVVQPCSDSSIAMILEMAGDIPVIAYNEASNAEVDAFVGRNSYDMYHSLAEAMIEKYPSGKYALVYGDEGTMVARDGSQGILDAIAENPDIEIVSEQFNSDWNPETAMQQVEAALSANNDEISAVISMNDSMAVGVLQALDAVGLVGKVGLCGTDTELAVAQAIVEGRMDMTCFTEYGQMAQDAVTLADCLIQGKDFPEGTETFDNGYDVPYIPTAYSIITQENMEEFLDSHDWWLDKDEVYAGTAQ